MSFLYDMLTKEEMEEIREHDGYVRGLKEGHARGAAERDRDIATNMLAMGMDIPVIVKATGLSEEDILELRQTDTPK